MSNPKCYECAKTVYPLEAVNTMAHTWHKICFKCAECGTKLTQQTAQPHAETQKIYCSKHYPKVVATVVTETPVLNTAKNAPKVEVETQSYNKASSEKPSSVGEDVVSASKKNVPKVEVEAQSFNRASEEKATVGVSVAFEAQKNAPKVEVEAQSFNKASENKPNYNVVV
eukprot:TRINITY_DN328_c0_g1_i1.p1 TRINITY_DN328_c0_g1~~TRINITY_DN328_c0_g1_i1.p1  ORF type:complete len:170 (-),score=53.96 TRINITY_DN328_c0_g1_i1:77-586(-)